MEEWWVRQVSFTPEVHTQNEKEAHTGGMHTKKTLPSRRKGQRLPIYVYNRDFSQGEDRVTERDGVISEKEGAEKFSSDG